MKYLNERLIIVFLLIVIAALALQTCFHKQQQLGDLQEVVRIKQDTITLWKDKAGLEHGQKQLAEADISILKAAYQAEIDSITKLLNIKAGQVEAYTGVSTRASGSVIPKIDTIYLADSTKEYKFGYNDKWLTLDGRIGKLPVINYTVFDSLGITVYNKRKNFFAPSLTYIDVYSLNPNVKVTGLTGFRVPIRKAGRFGIGPYIGFGWYNGQWQPSAGVSLQYSIIRF